MLRQICSDLTIHATIENIEEGVRRLGEVLTEML